jgi:predicted HAD superfamily hydrolase
MTSHAVPLLSLDVFDTLLTRVYARPADVFFEVAHALAAQDLLREAPEAWVARRMAVEAKMWREGAGSARLEDIYAELGEAADWAPGEAQRACGAEIEIELASHVPIPQLRARIEAWRRAGGTVAFVSDMYLPGAALRRSLERHGWIGHNERLFVSSDHQATKARGLLFGRVMSATGVAARAITHIGDNPRADLVAPRRLGIHAEHFVAATLNRYERRVADLGGGPDRAASLYAGCMRLARLEMEHAQDNAARTERSAVIARTSAAVAGPVLTAFALWVLQRAATLGIRRLYFLARDGQILYRIAEALGARERHGIDIRYLYASRQAWHPPAIVDLDDSDFDWLFDGAAISLQRLARRLSLNTAQLANALQGSGIAAAPEAVLTPAELGQLRRLMMQAPLRELILERAGELREAALAYFRQEGLFDGESQAIVDVGWNGRLQRSLGKMLAAAGSPAPTRGFYFGLWRKARAHADDRMEAFFHDPDRACANRALCNGPLLEQFTEADHGTTLSFAQADQRWTPVLKETHNHTALAWGLQTQHEAILAFARLVSLHFLPRVPAPPADFLRAACAGVLEEFLFRPDLAESEVYGSFGKTDAQEHSEQFELAPRLGTLTALRLGLVGLGRLRLPGDPPVLWLPASLARSGLPWMNAWVRVRSRLAGRLAH